MAFAATILAGSALLFLVQPLVARIALPRFGGAPAVWNSAMLVYQALLLAGYAYAHAIARLAPRRQAAVHLALLAVAALWLPIGLNAGMAGDLDPALAVPLLFAASIGPLFVAISAQAPLLQRWFAAACPERDPYPLYAASNLGSFAGLIAYPLLVEPLLPVAEQRWLWSAGYVAVAALVIGCAAMLPRRSSATAIPVAATGPTPRRTLLRWTALALVPSGLMLATSTFVTTDIVAVPLLWVLPLGLYLLSFTIAFAARRGPADMLTRIAPVTILLFGGVMMGGYQDKPYMNAGIALVLLFMVSVALHTALFRSRPAPERLTGFYLATAAGGALGGIFAALLAPAIFDWTWEYPILILAAGLLVPQLYLTPEVRAIWHHPVRAAIGVAAMVAIVGGLLVLRHFGPPEFFGEDRQGVTFIVLAAAGMIAIGARVPYTILLAGSLVLFGGWRSFEILLEGDARTRSYFGIYTISETGRTRTLVHGTTIHGIQLRGSPERERWPTSYYAPGSGVGQAMRLAPALYGPNVRIGVVGLGAGTLACYATPGARWTFYEIDPAVVRIAKSWGGFTFLSRCLPDPDIRVGDARVRIAEAPARSLDLLALDAFSSDTVPLHLLTREAFAAYGRALAPEGLLLVHVSNRFLDLDPVVAAAAREGGWHAIQFNYVPSVLDRGATLSSWIALSRDRRSLRLLAGGDPGWRMLEPRRRVPAWTDDFASILPLLKWE